MSHEVKERQRRGYVTGTPPGAIITDPNAARPELTVIAYSPEAQVTEDLRSVAELDRYVDEWPVVWLNVDGLGDADVIRRIGERFGLHRLALEDVVNTHQRSKVEEYGEHLFVVGRMVSRTAHVESEQIAIFLVGNVIITFQEQGGDCLDVVRRRIRQNRGKIRKVGPDYLLYCLLDAVTDAYFPILDGLSEAMELLEDEVVEAPTNQTLARVHGVKRDLLTLRREISSLREAVNALIRDSGAEISDDTRLHLRDCYDHTIRIHELVDSYREIMAGLLDVYLSSVSNHMNEVMRVLTVIATLFIPLTFLVGVYGMNFSYEASPYNMPELYWHWGYPALWLFMLVLAGGQLLVFWRKGWLTGFRLTPIRRRRSP